VVWLGRVLKVSRAFTISESIELEILVEEELARLKARLERLDTDNAIDAELFVMVSADVALYEGILANITSWRA
jgi:hypothetical protein